MITALDGINDRIDGLDGGADDYLVKPFDVKELQARVRALLRRPRTIKASDSLSYSDITYNMNTFTLQKDDKSITLSRKEGALLECLMKHKEQVLTRDQILNMVWGMDSFVEDGNIDNYIFFLRRRLKALNSKAAIKTVHGVGYKLENTDYA
jgi:DNA-binding response OmpR family regulator